jgi:ABC-type polar amino acid transport system ATPase subunit
MEAAGGLTPPASALVRIRGLHLRRGARTVLDGVSVDVHRGSIVALMGASGSGKTTMLRALAGLEPFDTGTLDVDDVRLAGGGALPSVLRALRAKVGMVFQFHCLFEHMTAVRNVWLAPVHVHGVSQREAETRAMGLLRQLGVEHRAHALPRELSGGEAQRVAIARALAIDPPVLLMDEPTASLDPARRVELGGLLRDLVSRGRTLVVATHDEDFVSEVATHVIRLDRGRVTGGASAR